MLLQFTHTGIHCPAGAFHIDPWLPAERAVITHAHSDHARWGSRHYLAHHDSAPALRLRLGSDISLQTVEYGERLRLNGVTLSLHPAGHIPGSAQVRVEKDGEVWVASGDYKILPDGLCTPFEPIRCHSFITESTFGLPVFRWPSQESVLEDIRHWWATNREAGICSILCAYSLGKAQRLIRHLPVSADNTFLHGAVHRVQEAYRAAGHPYPALAPVGSLPTGTDFRGALVIAPPAVAGSAWLRRFGRYSLGICSGWMQVRGHARRRQADRGFIFSDHADWQGLLTAVRETEARQVFVTHGYTDIFSRYISEDLGLQSHTVKTAFGTPEEEDGGEDPAAEQPATSKPSAT
jgi:putative mRNA 3-end processing factor